jgi:hypothetical protein
LAPGRPTFKEPPPEFDVLPARPAFKEPSWTIFLLGHRSWIPLRKTVTSRAHRLRHPVRHHLPPMSSHLLRRNQRVR